MQVPADADVERAAAAAAEAALQEAQQSARRVLAERQAAEREAVARAAAERTAAARAQAERRAAEAAARAEAQRVAAQARQRAAERQAEAARTEALRRESARLVEERAARAQREAAAAAEAEAAAKRAAAVRDAGVAQAPAAVQGSPRLVMVADDSKVVRVKTSRLLAAHGFRVALAEDGAQALAMIGQERPQVLVTDVEMPQLDGLELTRRLRADPRTAELPVIMITSADDRLVATARDVGVTLLMGKPYGEQDFVTQVARLAGVTLDA
ncbi:MAG: hypothetical protein ABS84_03570 [Rubrivivax sp. SCN 71-131]|nr:MAG: hypothetical protein ABS84_03570 [Rubrivivax sp. SCN 71-131]